MTQSFHSRRIEQSGDDLSGGYQSVMLGVQRYQRVERPVVTSNK